MGFEPTTFGLEVQRASPLRHAGLCFSRKIMDDMYEHWRKEWCCPKRFVNTCGCKSSDPNEKSATHMLPWRNWLARSTVNRKVGGSSPPGSVVLREPCQGKIDPPPLMRHGGRHLGHLAKHSKTFQPVFSAEWG